MKGARPAYGPRAHESVIPPCVYRAWSTKTHLAMYHWFFIHLTGCIFWFSLQLWETSNCVTIGNFTGHPNWGSIVGGSSQPISMRRGFSSFQFEMIATALKSGRTICKNPWLWKEKNKYKSYCLINLKERIRTRRIRKLFWIIFKPKPHFFIIIWIL